MHFPSPNSSICIIASHTSSSVISLEEYFQLYNPNTENWWVKYWAVKPKYLYAYLIFFYEWPDFIHKHAWDQCQSCIRTYIKCALEQTYSTTKKWELGEYRCKQLESRSSKMYIHGPWSYSSGTNWTRNELQAQLKIDVTLKQVH